MGQTAQFSELDEELRKRARILVAGHRSGRVTVDDLVQDTFSKLLRAYGADDLESRPRGQVLAMAWRTMRNLAVDATRKKREVLDSDGGDDDARPSVVHRLPDARPAPDVALGNAQRIGVVRELLDELPEEQRVFLATVLETDSVPKAQKKAGWPPKSPYYQLRLLHARLRERLQERGVSA